MQEKPFNLHSPNQTSLTFGQTRRGRSYSGNVGSTKLGSPKQQSTDTQQFYKTKMCPLILHGLCSKRNSCRFAHYENELRPLPDLSCTRLCDFFIKGVTPCPRENCPFAHTRESLRTSHDTFHKVALCNFYKRNRCLNGEFCRFAHGSNDLKRQELFRRMSAETSPKQSGTTTASAEATDSSNGTAISKGFFNPATPKLGAVERHCHSLLDLDAKSQHDPLTDNIERKDTCDTWTTTDPGTPSDTNAESAVSSTQPTYASVSYSQQHIAQHHPVVDGDMLSHLNISEGPQPTGENPSGLMSCYTAAPQVNYLALVALFSKLVSVQDLENAQQTTLYTE